MATAFGGPACGPVDSGASVVEGCGGTVSHMAMHAPRLADADGARTDAPAGGELVPLYVPGVLFADRPEVLSALSACGRQLVGPNGDPGRVELDLTLVAGEVSAECAEQLRAYYYACRGFWARLAHGGRPGAYVALRRPLLRAAQIDNKTQGKVMLHDELEALEGLPGVGELMQSFLQRELDPERVTLLAAPFGGTLELDGVRAKLQIVVEGRILWPRALGGAGTAGEVRRHLELGASHAVSRDRASRRLMSVAVDTEEIWPAPHA